MNSDEFPVFVTFDDFTNPTTIRKFHIDGTRYKKGHHDRKHFRDYYGSNAKVLSVVIENTTDTLTTGEVERALGNGFFESWHRLAHGRNPDGKCWNDNFRKTHENFCSTGRGHFIYKWRTKYLEK